MSDRLAPYEVAPGVLRNKLGVTDPDKLAEAERYAAGQRVFELELGTADVTLPAKFSFERLQATHRYILQDVYSWAGDMRTSETGAMGQTHCRPEFLPEQTRHTFRQIQRNLPSSTDRDAAVDQVAKHWGETTALHPFRDGNSRSQRSFFDQMLRESGWAVDWRRVDANAVHAARHVAMATVDSRYLADLLRPATMCSDELAPGAFSETTGSRDARSSQELFRSMMEHKSAGTAEVWVPPAR
ncbi:Fic/DOC family protein [Rhodococcus sp. NPDC058521]|uniref:Fic/DOC family protein n=1 Tax=Rhodococcus sp. NPDC058521 TaxID=3346536 RepID=UPI003664FC47